MRPLRDLPPLALVSALLGLLLGAVLGACGSTPSAPSPTTGDGWERLPDPPLAGRTGAGLVAVGDRVYAFGGWAFLCPPSAGCAGPEQPPFADGAVLDLADRTWRPIADAPLGFVPSSTAVLGDDVYVVASCTRRDCRGRPRLLRYGTAADAWTDLGDLPAGVGTRLVATAWGLVALAGSYEARGEVDAILDTGDAGPATWTPLPPGPLPESYDRFAVADGDRLVVLGSPRVGPDEEAAPKAAAALDLATRTWTSLPPAPGAGYQVWRVGDRAVLNPHFGPEGGGVLDLRGDAWEPFPAGPDAPGSEQWRGDLAGVVGTDEAAYEYAEGWVLDVRDGSWLRVPDRRAGDVSDAAVAAAGRALVVFGGQEWDGDEGRLLAEAWVWTPPAQPGADQSGASRGGAR